MDDEKRYISVEESLIEACKEVKLMRAGKLPEKSIDEFLEELKEWIAEEEENESKSNAALRVRR